MSEESLGDLVDNAELIISTKGEEILKEKINEFLSELKDGAEVNSVERGQFNPAYFESWIDKLAQKKFGGKIINSLSDNQKLNEMERAK